MPDYAKSLEEGFEAARKAEVAKKEIDEVFKELNTQVIKVTEGKVYIERKEFKEEEKDYETAAISILKYAYPRRVIIKYWVIIAFNPIVNPENVLHLARWEMDRGGYPCKVIWSKQDHICEDMEALANCLADLLKDPVVGEKLYTLTKLAPSKGN
jgi:hypothetical protein